MKFYNPFKPHLIKVGKKYAVRKFAPLATYLDIRSPYGFYGAMEISTSVWGKADTLIEAQNALEEYYELHAKVKASRKITVL